MKKIKKSFTIDLEVEYDYYPGYKPSAVQSHDDPRFSDPGEPPYIENIQFLLADVADDEDANITEIIEEFLPKTYAMLENLAYEKALDV